MQKTLIDNSELRTMQRALHDAFGMADLQRVRIATGYWDLKGVALVKDDIRAFLEREDTQLQLLIGKDPYIYANQMANPKYKNKIIYEIWHIDLYMSFFFCIFARNFAH